MSDKVPNVNTDPPVQSSGNQVTQNMVKKYTILTDVKQLQDRLQDMYTNRSDMVNITGDGWAAAHKNEIREITWVYVKALGWISGLHGAVVGVFIGMIGGTMAGVAFEVGLVMPALILFAISALFVLAPFVYMLYAETITEESGQWAVGQNTQMFFQKMQDGMNVINTSTWAITAVTFIGTLVLMGVFEKASITASMAVLKAMGIVMPEYLRAAAYNNGSIYGISWFALLMAGIYVVRYIHIERIREDAKAKADANKQVQGMYKNKDSLAEARAAFN